MPITKLIAVAGGMSDDRVADVVFVHGLDGHPRNTWQQNDWEETYWPNLLYNDVPTFGIWSFGYDASSTNWLGAAMPIVDRATNLAQHLRSESLGQRPLFFVVHSLGGLVVKQMLRSAYDQRYDDPLVQNTRGIFFFATPHMGSPLANYMTWLGVYRPSKLVKELEHSNSQLRDINSWYRANAGRLGIETIVFAETRPTKGVLVVDQTSSDPGITGVVPIPVDADHIEICKPGLEDLTYKSVRTRLVEFARDESRLIELGRTGNLWIDVSCFNKYPEQWEEKSVTRRPHQLLKYAVARSASEIQIRADLPYQSSVLAGEPVWALDFMWLPFRWLPLSLDLKMLNKGKSTLYVTRVDLLVEESVPNREPLVVASRGGLFTEVRLQNEGWGDITRSTLRYALEDATDQPHFPAEFQYECEVTWEDGTAQIIRLQPPLRAPPDSAHCPE